MQEVVGSSPIIRFSSRDKDPADQPLLRLNIPSFSSPFSQHLSPRPTFCFDPEAQSSDRRERGRRRLLRGKEWPFGGVPKIGVFPANRRFPTARTQLWHPTGVRNSVAGPLNRSLFHSLRSTGPRVDVFLLEACASGDALVPVANQAEVVGKLS